MRRKQIPVNLRAELVDALEKMADIQHRSRSNLIEAILEDAIKEKRVEYRDTRQLASLDKIERTRDTRPRKYRKDYQEVDNMPLTPEKTRE